MRIRALAPLVTRCMTLAHGDDPDWEAIIEDVRSSCRLIEQNRCRRVRLYLTAGA